MTSSRGVDSPLSMQVDSVPAPLPKSIGRVHGSEKNRHAHPPCGKCSYPRFSGRRTGDFGAGNGVLLTIGTTDAIGGSNKVSDGRHDRMCTGDRCLALLV